MEAEGWTDTLWVKKRSLPNQIRTKLVSKNISVIFFPKHLCRTFYILLQRTARFCSSRTDNLAFLTIYGYFGLPAPPALLYKLNINVVLAKKGEIKKTCVLFAFVQGSHGLESRETSWNLKMHFPSLKKSWILGKMAEVVEKQSWLVEFLFFSPNISCRLKTGNMLLVINPKYTPQIAGFSAFLSHGKTWKSH